MFDHLSLVWLLLIFAGAATAVWIAGVFLSNTTDVLSNRFGLGQAIGGVILLAVATNLPEIAITTSASVSGHLDIAVGNLIGGIALQTVVLVVLDVFGMKGDKPLTYRAASLSLVIEATLVVAMLALVIAGMQLPKSLVFARMTPQAIAIAMAWVAGIWMLTKARNGLPWKEAGDAPDNQDEPAGVAKKKKREKSEQKHRSTTREVVVFVVAALVTLTAGWLLETSGDAAAKHVGLTGVLFGATVLAASTSIPEISTGLSSVKMGDYKLACSDIFGGNAFLPVLFLLATLVSGKAVLPGAPSADVYLAGLAVLLTTVYIFGLLFRPSKRVLWMGIDSLVVLTLYAVGMSGLFAITQGHG